MERNEYMRQRALEIWARPVTVFMPSEKQLDTYTLEDDVVFSGRQLAKFSYKNTEQSVTSWVDMFQKVLQILHSEDKSVLIRLAAVNDDDVDLSVHVVNSPTDTTKYIEIDDNIYIWINTNTQYKITMLKKFFKLYDAEPADLVFYLKDDSVQDKELEGTRYEVRRRYWAYALDLIHKKHNNNAFGNVMTSKQNWVSGFVGYSGFQLCCVANYDSARMEMYLCNSRKEINKKAFDHLFMRKDEIERKLNAQLEWSRNDDIKSSKIFIQMNEVSINNEADWQKMAEFHTLWSEKFYDVFVPYLAELSL